MKIREDERKREREEEEKAEQETGPYGGPALTQRFLYNRLTTYQAAPLDTTVIALYWLDRLWA